MDEVRLEIFWGRTRVSSFGESGFKVGFGS